jgi:hypothetical protein
MSLRPEKKEDNQSFMNLQSKEEESKIMLMRSETSLFGDTLEESEGESFEEERF